MFKLPFFKDHLPGFNRPPQPFSERTLDKHPRIRGAMKTDSVCPYCAVGCATQIFTKTGPDGKDVVIDIEGNPNSPINEGTLCPKGANTFQLHHNPHRVRHVMYRAPNSKHWEKRPLSWALETIAHRLKDARDKDYKEFNEDGERINGFHSVGCLGGATLDNEENYLMKKLFGAGLQMVSIENQARI